MRRQDPFRSSVVIDLGFCPSVRLNRSRIHFSLWTSCGPISVVLGAVVLVAIVAILTDEDVLGHEAQIWVARGSDHGAVDGVVFAQDGKTLATVESNGHAILWDVATGRVSQFQPERFDRIRSLAFSPDGRTMVSGGMDSTIILWDMEKLKDASATSGAPSKGLRSRLLTRWQNAGLGQCGWHIDLVADDGGLFSYRSNPFSDQHLVDPFLTRRRRLATSHSNGELRLRDVGSPEESFLVGRYVSVPPSIAFSPDGRTMAVSTRASSQIQLWDLTERRIREIKIGPATGTPTLGYSPDGRFLVVTGDDGTIQLWDVTIGHKYATVRAHRAHVLSVAFFP